MEKDQKEGKEEQGGRRGKREGEKVLVVGRDLQWQRQTQSVSPG